MAELDDRFNRQIPFLTEEGFARIQGTHFVLVGVGGLGSHVAQQLAYLGARRMTLIDMDPVDSTNLNRLVTAVPEDVGTPKVDVLARFVRRLDPDAEVRVLRDSIRSARGFAAIKSADWVVGCLDHDGPRYVLACLAAAHRKPYLDLATEIGEGKSSFGGRLAVSKPGAGCLECLNLLSKREVAEWFESPEQARARQAGYGQGELDRRQHSGPSVVGLNGVLASLGVMELMLDVAGIRPAITYREYRGPLGVIVGEESRAKPNPSACRVCSEVGGKGDAGVRNLLPS